MTRKYRQHTGKSKFKIALEALKGSKPVEQISQEYQIAASQIYTWKKMLEDNGAQLFESKTKAVDSEAEIEQLLSIIGKLKVENDFLEKALSR